MAQHTSRSTASHLSPIAALFYCPLPSLTPFVSHQVFEKDGTAANDFIFEHNVLNGTTLHVRSAPTPACTASMAIADHVVDTAEKDFGWKEGK